MRTTVHHPKLQTTAILAAISLLGSGSAFATNGYFSHGYGTQSKAMAGTGVARSLDTLAPATNPAGLFGVEDGIDAGMGWFSPDRGYEVTGGPSGACFSAQQCTFGVGPANIRSDKDYFLIPHFGWKRAYGDNAAIGIAVYGNGGMNSRYVGGSATFGVPMGTVPPGVGVTMPGTFGDGTAGVDLMQMFIAPTYARAFGEASSFGFSPIIALQSFEARGLGNFAPFSSDPAKLTNNGHDTSYGMGLKVGVQSQLGEGVRFGASYQTKISMSEFEDYAGLFAGQGDFDIPATATVGLAVDAGEKMTVSLDVQWIGYGDVDSISNPMLPNLMMAPLGADGGAGFGWDDMTVYKIGADYRATADATWYFGYSQTSQPIPSSEVLFNILAPGVVEKHFTFGYSRAHGGAGNRWSVSAMIAPSTEVRGVNPLDPAQTVELSMDQYEVEFSYHFKG